MTRRVSPRADIRNIIKGTGATSTPPGTRTSSAPQPGPISEPRKSKRDRRSLYMSDMAMTRIHESYKQFNHEIFPLEVKKISYLDALITVALNHPDELRAHLLREPDAEEDDE